MFKVRCTLSTERIKSLFHVWQSPSLFASLVLLVTTFFFWDGVDLLTPFIFPLVAMGVWIIFGMVFLGAIAKAISNSQEKAAARFRFVALDLAVALVALFFPMTAVRNWCDFYMNLPARTAVVGMVSEGKLSGTHNYNSQLCALPFWLQYLSKSGEVVVTDSKQGRGVIDGKTLHVFFFTFRGILSRHSGFEYSADDSLPFEDCKAKEIEHLCKNWYWAAY